MTFIRIWNLYISFTLEELLEFIGQPEECVVRKKRDYVVIQLPEEEANDFVETYNNTEFHGRRLGCRFHEMTQKMPKDIVPIDLTPIIEDAPMEEQLETANQILESMRKYGIVQTRDPRVPFELNDSFQRMMENYFARDAAEKAVDVRKESHYQVGYTPEHVERAENRCSDIAAFDPFHRPVTLCPPEADLKGRYFWSLGEINNSTEYSALNQENVIPANAENWEELCNEFGNALLESTKTIGRGLAMAYGLDREYFVNLMEYAPHKLAPTASDLSKHATVDSVFAGYHADLNFITTHGKSRFPGLFIWLRDGRRVPVTMPNGCLLSQAGMMLEHYTGGDIVAGMHEVVCTQNTINKLERQLNDGRPLWRVSTTMFAHIRSDACLEVIDPLSTTEAVEKYPPTTAGDHVMEVLDRINLSHEH